MRAITAVLAAAAIASGCTGTGDAQDVPEATATPSTGVHTAGGGSDPGRSPTSLLLTVEDLPAGWAVDPPAADPTDGTRWPDCPALEELRIEEDGEAQFLGPTGNVGLSQEVAAASGAEIERVVGATAAAGDCGTIRGSLDDGTTYELTFSSMDVPAIAGVQRAVATVASGTYAGDAVERVLVAAEVGRVLMGMHSTAFDDESPLDVVALLQTVAAKTS